MHGWNRTSRCQWDRTDILFLFKCVYPPFTPTRQEIGMDFANMKATKVGVWTDPTVAKLLPMKNAIESLEEAGIAYEIYDKTRVEPNQTS